MFRKIIVTLLLILLPVLVSAQLKSQEKGVEISKILRYGISPVGLFSGSFLNSDKFHMSQSYSYSMSTFGGNSMGQAMYLNTMSYQFSDPLSFTLQWGYTMNQSFGENKALGFNRNLPFSNGLFISGAQLKYKPTKNSELKIEFSRVPYNSYYGGMPYRLNREF